MHERAALLVQHLCDCRVAVAQGVDRDSGCEVEVLPVLDVVEVAAFAFVEHGRGADVGGHHVLLVRVYEAGGLRVGWGIGCG